jgi:alpha-beta hydrolase superfamily lysophospholipase
MESPAIRRVESHVAGPRGQSLFRRAWLPPAPERTLLVVHGFGEHCGRYEHLGAWFAAHACAVHAYDHIGHGASSGARCHVRRFDDYLDDLGSMLALVRQEHPDVPVFLVGHSMGGLIVAAFLRERDPAVAGAILSGAALALPEGTSRMRLTLARVLRVVAPRANLASPVDPAGLSTDPEVVEAYLKDPLVHHDRMTASLAAELLSAIQRTEGHGADVRVPMLVLHGAEDPMCRVEGSQAFARELREGHFHSYPGMRHEIFNEPGHEAIFQDALDWIRLRDGAAA